MKNQLISILLFIIAFSNLLSQTITINSRIEYQTIDGFGCFQPWDAPTAMLIDDLGATIIRTGPTWGLEYIDDDGIPFNHDNNTRYFRNTFSGNAFNLNLDGFKYNSVFHGNTCFGEGGLDIQVGHLKRFQSQALNNNEPLKIIASNWSPPHWTKYAACLFGMDRTWNRVDNGMGPDNDWTTPVAVYSASKQYMYDNKVVYNGLIYKYNSQISSKGHLPTDANYWIVDERKNMYYEVAEFHAGYIKLLERENINIYAISLQNEPAFPEPYGSCVYSSSQYRDALLAHDTMFNHHNMNVKMFGPEDMAATGLAPWTANIFKDSKAKNRLDILAVHGYTDGISADLGNSSVWESNYQVALASGKNLWMTETSGYPSTWTGGFNLAKSMYLALKFGKISAWVWWSWYNPYSENETLVGSSNSPTKKYWVSKNYFRYIRPGAVMIDATSTDPDINVLAFKDGKNATLTYVFLNTGNTQKIATLDEANLPTNAKVYRTSETENCAEVNSYNTGTIALPAKSISTLVFKGENKTPTINQIQDTTLLINPPQCNIQLTNITDGDNGNQVLSISASSSDNSIISDLIITKVGATSYNLSFTPLANKFGEVKIDVKVTDNGSSDILNQTTTSFKVKILPFINAAPTIHQLTTQTVIKTAAKISIKLTGVSDGNDGSQSLSCIINSSSINQPRSLKVNSVAGIPDNITFYVDSIGTYTISLIIKDNGGKELGGEDTKLMTFTLLVNNYVGLNVSNENNINIHPNPAQNILNISSNYLSPYNVSIHNNLGNIVYKNHILINNSQIDVSHLLNGMYIIVLENDEMKITKTLSIMNR